MRWTAAVWMVLFCSPAFPCLVFCVSDGELVLAGNNEDYLDPDTRVWFVPGEGWKHGRMFFGYADGFPQGGMNDAGLFFDGLALEPEPIDPKPDAEPVVRETVLDTVLAECASVAEAIAFFERRDRRHFSAGQLLFADRSGDGAIIEGAAVIRKKGKYLLATNFRQSKTTAPEAACPRYRLGTKLLEQSNDVSLDLCRRVLSATHQEGEVSTLYSNIHDLRRGLVYLYHFHDFERPVVIDLAAELAKGPHVVEIASLFEPSFAFEEFRRTIADNIARAESERDRSVDPRTLNDCAGHYRADEGLAAGLEFRLRVADGKLVGVFPTKEGLELIPRGGMRFVCVSNSTRADFEFVRGPDGKVTSVTIRQSGIEVQARKQP